MQQALETFLNTIESTPSLLALDGALRYVFPLLALVILLRCGKSLLLFRREPEVWAWLAGPTGDRIPVMHWESLIGRGKGCDVTLEYPTISRTHAVLTRYDDGSWTIMDAGSTGGVLVNGKPAQLAVVQFGDVLSFGGVDFTLVPITQEQERIQAEARTRRAVVRPWLTLLVLTLFQLLACAQLCVHLPENGGQILPGFLALIAMQWGLFALLRLARRRSFDVETVAFFLTTMGLCVVSTSAPEAIRKELIAVACGIFAYLAVSWSLRDLERAKKIRYLAAAGGILLLAANLVLGVEKFGAKNWMQLGGISFQPSELVKICFVFAGASTLQRLMAKRNLILFIGYSAAICGCLALMNDFGTAIIFFITFLIIAFLRSGNFATIALACAGTGFAGVLALHFKPYAMKRFSVWGHVWENASSTGYSQTRALMCIASGGLFGLGAGKGWLHHVGAADTDLVFALVSEEWGLLLAGLCVAAIVLLAAFVVRSLPVGTRSGISALRQIDKSIEESAYDLGAGSGRVFMTVTLPLIKDSFFSGLVTTFVRSITAISAIILLVTPRYLLITCRINEFAEKGAYGVACAYATILILIVYAAILIMNLGIKYFGTSKQVRLSQKGE